MMYKIFKVMKFQMIGFFSNIKLPLKLVTLIIYKNYNPNKKAMVSTLSA